MRKPVTADDRTEFLENTHYPLMRDAFLTSIDDIVTTIDLTSLEKYIGEGDIQKAYSALHIDDVAFRPYDVSFANALEQSAISETIAMPAFSTAGGNKVVVRYDVRNIESSRWLQEYLGGFISSITDEQRVSIQNYIQQGINDNLRPRTIALGIAGRIDPETRARQGGIVGLSAAQQDYTINAHRELTSGSLSSYTDYLNRALRDRHFDSIVRNYAATGKALSEDDAGRIVQSYSNRLLRYRAGLIARVESATAINQGRIDAYGQAIRRGALRADSIEKTWRSQRDKDVRLSHKVLNGQSIALYDKFKSPTGAMLFYPCDPMAPANERLGCRCRMFIRVNGVVR